MSRLTHLTYFLPLIGGVALSTGCYANSRGAAIGVERVPNTERPLSSAYELAVARRPTPDSPKLSLRISEVRKQSYQARQQYTVLRGPSPTRNLLGGAFWIAAGVLSITESGKHLSGDTLSDGGSAMRAGGGIALVGGLFMFLKAMDDSPPTPVPGRVMSGDRETRIEILPARAIPGQRVRISSPFGTNEVLSDAAGEVDIDLHRETRQSEFSGVSEIPISVSSQLTATPLQLTVRTTDWTRPCVRTTARGFVLASPRAGARSLGEFVSGERYELRADSTVDWYGIEFRSQVGWIPRLSGSRCWVAIGG